MGDALPRALRALADRAGGDHLPLPRAPHARDRRVHARVIRGHPRRDDEAGEMMHLPPLGLRLCRSVAGAAANLVQAPPVAPPQGRQGQGKMQPSPSMLCVWAELLTNILLPMIAVPSSAHPTRNALASFAVYTCLMVVTCWSPPKLDRGVNLVVHTSHLLACVAFGSATVSVLIEDPTSWTAPVLLCGGMA